MDIIKFLNSKSIAEYLQSIDYKFSPEEALFVIHASRHATLQEKRDAYLQLVAAYPDYKLSERRCEVFKDQTLSQFVATYIDKEMQLIAECKRDGDDAVYYAMYFSKEDDCWEHSELRYATLYRSFQQCVEATLLEDGEDVVKLRITKKYLEQERRITLDILPDGTELGVTCSESDDTVMDAFDWMWIDIPTPFKRGDLVKPNSERVWDGRRHSKDEDVMVLTEILTWTSQDLKNNGYKNASKPQSEGEINFKEREKLVEMFKKEGDTSDMMACGYFVGEDGNIYRDHLMGFYTYLDLEYYTGELKEKKRFLTALANYINGKISIELLLLAYKIILLQDDYDDARAYLKDWYKDYVPKLLGLE